MTARFIEAHDGSNFNWGKFALCRFSSEEWDYESRVSAGAGIRQSLLGGRGWSPQHLLVLDIQTGEGAVFLPGGMASHDLNNKHQIRVCPMFEPFLEWLYRQDTHNLDALPAVVNLGDVPVALSGHRRKGARAR